MNQRYSYFISSTLNIPPVRLKNAFNAITNFIIPRTMLDKDLTFFLAMRDGKMISNHSMPNVIAAEINSMKVYLSN